MNESGKKKAHDNSFTLTFMLYRVVDRKQSANSVLPFEPDTPRYHITRYPIAPSANAKYKDIATFDVDELPDEIYVKMTMLDMQDRMFASISKIGRKTGAGVYWIDADNPVIEEHHAEGEEDGSGSNNTDGSADA
jgi:hypothetical protein